MTYFLDFDRTLFDTSAFLDYVLERDSLDRLRSLSEVGMATELNVLADEGTLTFAPRELKRFLYADAETFLKQHQSSSVIVTAGNVALQRVKLESTFSENPTLPIFYNGDEEKGIFISRMLDAYQSPHVFIDDKIVELDSVAHHCPSIALYEMRRDGGAGHGTYAVINSFDEVS